MTVTFDWSLKHLDIATHVPNDQELNSRDSDPSTSRSVRMSSTSRSGRQLFHHTQEVGLARLCAPSLFVTNVCVQDLFVAGMDDGHARVERTFAIETRRVERSVLN